MKVNKELNEFHISIKELIIASYERKYISSGIPLQIRALKGIKIHQFYQKKRKKTEKAFQSEVLVKFELEVQGWRFIISGRTDIVYEKDDILIIEEIKSISDLDNFKIESMITQDYRLQLLLYGHYFLQLGNKIQCHLVLIDIFSKKTKIIEIPPLDMSEYIQKQCEMILLSWELAQKLKIEQKKRAKTVIFPFEEYRPHQEEIIQKVLQNLRKRERLMLVAPSGLGKTVGTLFPSLKFALKNNLRVFIVTSKTTQQNIYKQTLQIFTKKKAKFNSIILTAKEKMCINSSLVCEPSLCPYLENYNKVSFEEIIPEILNKQVIDATVIKKVSKQHKICPFEISLDCSLYCDIIVGDYNYVFHPYIKLKRFFNQAYDDIILIVDEAHNLPSRAMTYYSPEITLQSIFSAIDYCKSRSMPKSIEEQFIIFYQQICKYIIGLMAQFEDSKINKPIIKKFDKKFFHKIAKDNDQLILKYLQNYLFQQGSQPSRKDKIIEFAINLRQFFMILKECDCPEYSELLYRKEKKIKILCKSAASKLKKQLKGFHSVIMQSATLFPLDYFQKMLGFPPSSQKIQYPSPFSQKNRLYILIPYLSTKYEYREESYDQIASMIYKTVNIRYGNYLAFFPSFAYLNAVKREIERFPISVELIVQEKQMSERKRKTFLEKLKDPNKKYLLLAVHGGIFSEGVDYIGEMAIGVFIIGPGLPAFSIEQELMRKYFEFKWKKGFEYAYRNPGMMKVIQAAGRIFRTSTDRGFVMLIGHRFSTPYYNSVFPSDWKIEQSQNHIKRIQNFWKI